MKTKQNLGIVFCLIVAIVFIVYDYFKPPKLEVDLNFPRFRLVRHRLLFPDQSFQMEWKHISRWAFSAEESRPVFGQIAPGGRYAWELNSGSRFEGVYQEGYDNSVSDEWLRTNIFAFEMGTYKACNIDGTPSSGYVMSANDWAKSRHPKTTGAESEAIHKRYK